MLEKLGKEGGNKKTAGLLMELQLDLVATASVLDATLIPTGRCETLRPVMVVHLGPYKDTGKGLGSPTPLHCIPNQGSSRYRSGAQACTDVNKTGQSTCSAVQGSKKYLIQQWIK